MSLKNLPGKIRFFVHPWPLTAVALMALNDHWLKDQFHNELTGKLSDFCGVFYFPIFILALIATLDEVIQIRRFRLTTNGALAAIAFTDCLMLIVKLSPVSGRAIEQFFADHFFQIQLIQDPTDLISFAVNPLTYFYLRSYWSTSKLT